MSVTITQRISKLERTIRAEARAKLTADICAQFDPAITAINGNTHLAADLNAIRSSVIKSRAKDAEDQALEAFLRRATPSMTADEFFFPRKVKIGVNGEQLADDAKEHVAVLLPAFGRMFDATKPVLAKNWADAKAKACEIRVLGADDWYLPAAHELQLLVDRTKREPATDTAFFPITPTDYIYWTSTEVPAAKGASSPSGFAFFVYFGDGYVYRDLPERQRVRPGVPPRSRQSVIGFLARALPCA